MAKHSRANRMRSAARLYAVQALFQMEAQGSDLDAISQEFETHRFGLTLDDTTLEEGDPEHFRTVLREAVNNQARIDQATDVALKDTWAIDRIDPTLRSIFRAAGAELAGTVTPPKVIINEYVDVAKAFFPNGREPQFANAVLDHMARSFRPEAFAS